MQSQDNIGSFISGIVVGAVVGGVAAWLLTPYSGPQLRALVLGQGQTLKSNAETAVSQAQDTVRVRVEQAKTTIGMTPSRKSDSAEVV